jgi:hypothetical protein
VWGIIIALALIEPVMHVVNQNFAPKGAAPTGLHTVDTYAYLTCMKYGHGDYFSPYASCRSEVGDRHPSYYLAPHHHLNGFFGRIGRALHISPFYFLGIANGFGLAFWLVASYVLLRTVSPDRANTAFILFTLGGGLGGVAWVLTGILGLHDHALFAERFHRFFIYELSEGPRFQPYLLMARLYYTIPLGLGFFSLAMLIRALKVSSRGLLLVAVLLFFCCAFLNIRIGPMVWLIAMLYLACDHNVPILRRITYGLNFTGALVAGAVLVAWMVSRNPQFVELHHQGARYAVWLAPFIYATFFYWFLMPGPILSGLKSLPFGLRVLGFGALGYCVIFILAYGAYQAYYGNWFRGGEPAATIAISDKALWGVLAGAMVVLLWRPKRACVAEENIALSWSALWVLLFFGGCVSAFWGGSFLRITPNRFVVVMGLPMAILCAEQLQALGKKGKWIPVLAVRLIILFGLTSIIVTWTVSYGPLGYKTAQASFPWTNFSFMTKVDEQLLELVQDGVFLAPSAPPSFGDVMAQRPGVKVACGIGTLDFSHRYLPDERERIVRFYSPDAENSFRLDYVNDMCVDYIFCPDTAPVHPDTVAQLRQASWCTELASANDGVLFRVLKN